MTLAHLSDLPSVAQILKYKSMQEALITFGHLQTTTAIREVLEDARRAIRTGAAIADASSIVASTVAKLEISECSSQRKVFNLTGTILHTNFGRALLAETAVEAAVAAMRNAVSLEFDLSNGKHRERDDKVRSLLCALTGAEDATVVNNNAAAVLLIFNTFGLHRQSIISRGELIEIEGALRIPDIMTRAGTILKEVGTTNRTRLSDYRSALGPEIGLIFKVHTPNPRAPSFPAGVGTHDLSLLAKEYGVPLAHDLGSGTLVDLTKFGLIHEPTVQEVVADGADLVTFSGDKLLGGPQAGFIVGRKELLAEINDNPMKRAFRLDKIRLAALEATLKLYRDPPRLAERLPTIRMLARERSEIEGQAQRILPSVVTMFLGKFTVEVVTCHSRIGAGALIIETLPSVALAFRPKVDNDSLTLLAAVLRQLPAPVIGRIAKNALLLDLRCLEDEQGFLAALQMASTVWTEAGTEASTIRLHGRAI